MGGTNFIIRCDVAPDDLRNCSASPLNGSQAPDMPATRKAGKKGHWQKQEVSHIWGIAPLSDHPDGLCTFAGESWDSRYIQRGNVSVCNQHGSPGAQQCSRVLQSFETGLKFGISRSVGPSSGCSLVSVTARHRHRSGNCATSQPQKCNDIQWSCSRG